MLDADPELGEDLDEARFERARLAALARAGVLNPGEWRESEWPAEASNGYGLLLLEGVLVRHVIIAGREGAEVLLPGDLLRPWQRDDAAASVLRRSAWRVLEGARVAVLDLRFALRIRAYPEITARLMARTLRRARHFAVIMAIVHQPRVDDRLLMVLWHLADRCGRTGRDGVTVPMRFTHELLADLLAARRPTVSGALSSLERAGRISHNGEGWVLHGAPPGELREPAAPHRSEPAAAPGPGRS